MSKKILLVLVLLASLPVSASFTEALKQTGSIIVGIPVGFVIGGTRGAVSKASQYGSDLSEDLGDNTIAKVVGYPTGIVVGAVGGLVTGVTRGLVDAFYYGINDPFSPESLSVEGEFLDYDPYEVIHYKDGESKKVN